MQSLLPAVFLQIVMMFTNLLHHAAVSALRNSARKAPVIIRVGMTALSP